MYSFIPAFPTKGQTPCFHGGMIEAEWLVKRHHKNTIKKPSSPYSAPLEIRALHSLKLTAFAPENGWLEDYFPFGMAYF